MKKEDLLKYCKFYNPNEHPSDISVFWNVEEKWVRLCSEVIERVHDLEGDELELLSDDLEMYSRRIVRSFTNIHEISALPPSLLGMLWSACVLQFENEFNDDDSVLILGPAPVSSNETQLNELKECFIKNIKEHYG